MARSVTEAVDKLETGAARDDVHDDIHIEAGEAGGAGAGSAATASGEVVRAPRPAAALGGGRRPEDPCEPDTGHTPLRVSRGDSDVIQRFRTETRATALPGEPILLRVYRTGDRPTGTVEAQFHRRQGRRWPPGQAGSGTPSGSSGSPGPGSAGAGGRVSGVSGSSSPGSSGAGSRGSIGG